MKKYIRFLFLLVLMLPGVTASSQKYKNIEDTIKLNKEYAIVSYDIVILNDKLSTAQNDLDGYKAKAKNAIGSAADAASASSDQASKATNGSVGDAKKAKRKASKAYKEAKDLKAADSKVKDQENKISRYESEIKKKQQRLEALDKMRTSILENRSFN